jgi:hypothetical protein
MDAATWASVVASGAAVAFAVAAGFSWYATREQTRTTFNSILFDQQIGLTGEYMGAIDKVISTASRVRTTVLVLNAANETGAAWAAYNAAIDSRLKSEGAGLYCS